MLGFSSFAELPFATSSESDGAVTISVTGNALQISIGEIGITADSIVEIANPNRLTLGAGTVTITADANLSVTGNATSISVGTAIATADIIIPVTGNALTLSTGSVTVTGTALISPVGSQLVVGSGEPGIITWNDIVPGVNMTWTEIEPY
jgi:hypothetical protein